MYAKYLERNMEDINNNNNNNKYLRKSSTMQHLQRRQRTMYIFIQHVNLSLL